MIKMSVQLLGHKADRWPFITCEMYNAGSLLAVLKEGFRGDSSYWKIHSYFDPDTGFFSYFLPTLVHPLLLTKKPHI